MIGARSALFALLLGATSAAAAESPGSPAVAGENGSPSEDGGPEPVPPAADTLGGHFLLSAGPLLSVPFAQLDDRVDFSDVAGAGIGVAGKLGIGVARSLSLGGFAEYVSFGHPSGCNTCEATSLTVGPFVRYHLVQGVRFDPQITVGAGYRKLDATLLGATTHYKGVDWLRLELGGDWFALSQVGFGPYAELALGSFTDRPAQRDATLYGTFAVGLRVSFDAQGK